METKKKDLHLKLKRNLYPNSSEDQKKASEIVTVFVSKFLKLGRLLCPNSPKLRKEKNIFCQWPGKTFSANGPGETIFD